MQDVSTVNREERLRQEKGKALVRALHASELEAAGSARAAALREADAHLDRIAKRLPDALAGGLTLSEISRLTGVSRPTLYELRGRYSDAAGDVRLAVLQIVATRTPTHDELGAALRRPHSDLQPTVDEFIRDGLVEWDFPDTADEDVRIAVLPKGLDTLEFWQFPEHFLDADEVEMS